jgi:multidrug efflux system outer membrane protein
MPIAQVLIAVAMAADPCGPLDLNTALGLAANRSDEVAIKQADVATAEVDVALSRAIAILPMSSAQLLVGPDPAAHGDVTTVTSMAGNTNRSLNNLGVFERIDIQAVQPIWTWGQLSGARDAARAGLRARELLVDDTLSQVQLRVIQLFWGEALARKFLSIASDVEKALGDVDAQISKSLKAEDGQVSPQDKFQVALFRSELAGRKAEAIRGQELARIGLAATLAISQDRLRLKEIDLTSGIAETPNLDDAISRAETSRPDLRALAAAIDAKKGEVQAKEGALFPQVFIGAEFAYSFAYNRDIQLNPWVGDYFNTLSLGAALGLRQDLGIPALIAQKNKAKAELLAIERQRDGLRRLIDTQVESAVSELKAAQARASASRDGVAAGKGWFRAAGLDFEAGVGDAKALLTAYRGYVESQINAAQASYDVLVAKAKLDQATAVSLGPSAGGDPTCTLQ